MLVLELLSLTAVGTVLRRLKEIWLQPPCLYLGA